MTPNIHCQISRARPISRRKPSSSFVCLEKAAAKCLNHYYSYIARARAFGIGSLSQSITGYFGDLYGLDVAFYLLAVFALAALLISFKLPEKREI